MWKLVANDKEYYMKEKVNKYISSFDSIVYVLSHATNMQLFWSQLKANRVLPRVLIYDYLYYDYYYYYFEII
jgi:ABC-type branched-subunit amino acid transport system substrate-binding protein